MHAFEEKCASISITMAETNQSSRARSFRKPAFGEDLNSSRIHLIRLHKQNKTKQLLQAIN